MKVSAQTHTIEMLPIDAIRVLNSRARNRRQHHEIVENIGAIGLKRPITVSRSRLDELSDAAEEDGTKRRGRSILGAADPMTGTDHEVVRAAEAMG